LRSWTGGHSGGTGSRKDSNIREEIGSSALIIVAGGMSAGFLLGHSGGTGSRKDTNIGEEIGTSALITVAGGNVREDIGIVVILDPEPPFRRAVDFLSLLCADLRFLLLIVVDLERE